MDHLGNNSTLDDYGRADERGRRLRLIPLPLDFQLDCLQRLPRQRLV